MNDWKTQTIPFGGHACERMQYEQVNNCREHLKQTAMMHYQQSPPDRPNQDKLLHWWCIIELSAQGPQASLCIFQWARGTEWVAHIPGHSGSYLLANIVYEHKRPALWARHTKTIETIKLELSSAAVHPSSTDLDCSLLGSHLFFLLLLFHANWLKTTSKLNGTQVLMAQCRLARLTGTR